MEKRELTHYEKAFINLKEISTNQIMSNYRFEINRYTSVFDDSLIIRIRYTHPHFGDMSQNLILFSDGTWRLTGA